jgi:hypothetical protein
MPEDRSRFTSAYDRARSRDVGMAPQQEPPVSARIRTLIFDALGGNSPDMAKRRRAMQAADMLTGAGAEFAMGMTPVLGDAQAMYEAKQAYDQGDMGMAAMLGGLGVLGMVPVVGDIAKKGGEFAMDTASRMAMAADQGFDTSRPLYHSTNASFDVFEIPENKFLKYGKGVYTSPNPDYVDRHIRENRDIEARYKEGANLMPLYARGKIGTEKDWEQARQEMLAEGVNPRGHNPLQAEIQRRLKEKGFDGVNMFGNETIIFDPSNIRSVNAAFDPAKRGSANLLAGGAATAVGVGAMTRSQQEEQNRRNQ